MSIIHGKPHPLAGKTVKINSGQHKGKQFVVEDWADRVFGEPWVAMNGIPACVEYSARAYKDENPDDDRVLYGKIGGFGALIHLENLDPADLPEELEHTPGPWSQGRFLETPFTRDLSEERKAEHRRRESLRVFAGFTEEDAGRGRVHIATASDDIVHSPEEAAANARLMAAAPDMLEALLAIRDSEEPEMMIEEWDLLHAAVAKATGDPDAGATDILECRAKLENAQRWIGELSRQKTVAEIKADNIAENADFEGLPADQQGDFCGAYDAIVAEARALSKELSS